MPQKIRRIDSFRTRSSSPTGTPCGRDCFVVGPFLALATNTVEHLKDNPLKKLVSGTSLFHHHKQRKILAANEKQALVRVITRFHGLTVLDKIHREQDCCLVVLRVDQDGS